MFCWICCYFCEKGGRGLKPPSQPLPSHGPCSSTTSCHFLSFSTLLPHQIRTATHHQDTTQFPSSHCIGSLHRGESFLLSMLTLACVGSQRPVVTVLRRLSHFLQTSTLQSSPKFLRRERGSISSYNPWVPGYVLNSYKILPFSLKRGVVSSSTVTSKDNFKIFKKNTHTQIFLSNQATENDLNLAFCLFLVWWPWKGEHFGSGRFINPYFFFALYTRITRPIETKQKLCRNLISSTSFTRLCGYVVCNRDRYNLLWYFSRAKTVNSLKFPARSCYFLGQISTRLFSLTLVGDEK